MHKHLPSFVPNAISLLILRDPMLSGPGSLKGLTRRFNNWRRRHGPSGGLHGTVYERGLKPAVLLAIDAEALADMNVAPFEIQEVKASTQLHEMIDWWTAECEQEIVDAGADFPQVFSETQGRRRYQGFGTWVRFKMLTERAREGPEVDDGEVIPSSDGENHGDNSPKLNLGRIAGGAGKGKHDHDVRCPDCRRPAKRIKGSYPLSDFTDSGRGHLIPRPGSDLAKRFERGFYGWYG
jgi:hypothetical protein